MAVTELWGARNDIPDGTLCEAYASAADIQNRISQHPREMKPPSVTFAADHESIPHSTQYTAEQVQRKWAEDPQG